MLFLGFRIRHFLVKMYIRDHLKSPLKVFLCLLLLFVCLIRISHFSKHTRSLTDNLNVKLLYEEDDKIDYDIIVGGNGIKFRKFEKKI